MIDIHVYSLPGVPVNDPKDISGWTRSQSQGLGGLGTRVGQAMLDGVEDQRTVDRMASTERQATRSTTAITVRYTIGPWVPVVESL
jgi:hypothetical protein